MSALSAIREALLPLGYEISPTMNTHKSDTYITYGEIMDHGEDFGDDSPEHVRVTVRVHFICPYNKNYLTAKRNIRRAIAAADFTFPYIEDASLPDDNIRHLVYTTEYLETF